MDEASKATLYIVDDEPTNIHLLLHSLKEEYAVLAATSGEKFLEMMQSAAPLPDLILLDIVMPGMDGYAVCEQLKRNPVTRSIPVIFLTALDSDAEHLRGLSQGCVDYVTKPFHPEIVKARVRNHIELKRYRDGLERMVERRTSELLVTQEVTIHALATLAETRDPETGGHIQRTKNYVLALAQQLQHHSRFSGILSDEYVQLLVKSAPLHDVGKVGIHDGILNKPGKLTQAEFEEMKSHTSLGHDALVMAARPLGENSFLSMAAEVAHTHHEKWNGSGYPQGLSGDAIPASGRIMALADVYDALISKRAYKKPFTHARAASMIAEGRGLHFDPDIVDTFLAMQETFREIAIAFADFDEERVALSSSA